MMNARSCSRVLAPARLRSLRYGSHHITSGHVSFVLFMLGRFVILIVFGPGNFCEEVMGTPTHPFEGQQTFLDQIFKVTSSGLYGRISKFPVFNVGYLVFALQISDNFYLPVVQVEPGKICL